MKFLPFLALTLLLPACGSTSKVHSTDTSEKVVDLTSYNYVIIKDFTDGTGKTADDPHIIAEGKRFADLIASVLKSKGLFSKVERNVETADNALVIDGKITKYDEGSPVMRTLIGFGAGRSYFDAQINIKDNETQEILGKRTVKVD